MEIVAAYRKEEYGPVRCILSRLYDVRFSHSLQIPCLLVRHISLPTLTITLTRSSAGSASSRYSAGGTKISARQRMAARRHGRSAASASAGTVAAVSFD
jgi:hypothetical protein